MQFVSGYTAVRLLVLPDSLLAVFLQRLCLFQRQIVEEDLCSYWGVRKGGNIFTVAHEGSTVSCCCWKQLFNL